MTAFGRIAILVQIAGGLITFYGLDRSMRDILPGSKGLQGLRQLRWLGTWLCQLVRRKNTTLVVADVNFGEMSDTVRATVSAGPFPGGTIGEHLAHIDRRVDLVEQRISAEAETARQATEAVRQRSIELARDIERITGELKQYTREAVGGKKGRGLLIAAAGAFVVVLGAGLSMLPVAYA